MRAFQFISIGAERHCDTSKGMPEEFAPSASGVPFNIYRRKATFIPVSVDHSKLLLPRDLSGIAPKYPLPRIIISSLNLNCTRDERSEERCLPSMIGAK
jgi:hypothetical protein